MVVKGKTLILDNFRRLLSDYSVDIQDVVRSAILDGVDISKYIDVCKDNPYRLEQIRLAIKEDLDESLFSLNGDLLYRVRKLRKTGNLGEVTRQLKQGSLYEEHIDYLLDWVSEGRSIEGISLAIVPKNLLSVYDVGLSFGVDMSIFNGVTCTPEYLTDLVTLLKNKRSVDKFLNQKDWDDSVVHLVSSSSGVFLGWYDKWVDCLTSDISFEMALMLKELYTYMIRLNSKLWLTQEEIRAIKDVEFISVLVSAAKEGMNLRQFLGHDKFSANSLYMSNKQATKQKISGSIRGKRD